MRSGIGDERLETYELLKGFTVGCVSGRPRLQKLIDQISVSGVNLRSRVLGRALLIIRLFVYYHYNIIRSTFIRHHTRGGLRTRFRR